MRKMRINGRAYTLVTETARLRRVGGKSGKELSGLVARMRVAQLERTATGTAVPVRRDGWRAGVV